MYSEDKKGFSVRDILIQLLFIILFVFILVWLFPTKSSLNNQYDGINNKLDILTSTLFNTNIKTMKDAAVSYYTTARLPQALKDVERMTLKQMLDEKLLVEFVDGNGNSCDTTKSYVEVIKLEDEYQMKINLSCTDKDAYIIIHLGCYDYCSATGVCEKKEEIKITENKKTTCSYEYEKVTNAKWGDFGSWSGWTTTKVAETDYRKVETKTEKVLSGSEQIQTGTKVETISASGNTSTTCPTGYTRSGESCVRNATGYYIAKCPSGFTLNSDGTCSGSVGTTTTTSPTCPSGYTRSGSTCYKASSSTVSATPTCPSGYNWNGSTCTQTSGVSYSKGDYIETLTGYSVPAPNSSYYYETISSDYVYKCIGDNPCAFIWEYTYKKYKSVVSGGTTTTATPICDTANGYTLSGTTCIKPTTATETTSATCSNGTLSGDVCYIYGSQAKTVSATCPTGFTLKGNRCYGTKTTTVAVTTTTSYSCPSGYSLSGSSCTRTVPVYDTQNVYKNVQYYRYKEKAYVSGTRLVEWSTSQNDTYLIGQGYNLTGNKKCS